MIRPILFGSVTGGLVAVSLGLAAQLVWAARGGAVNEDDSPVYEKPSAKSKVIAKLDEGTQLVASNQPTQGFHKVRLKDGRIGWIAVSLLDLRPIPSGTPSTSEDGSTEIPPDLNASP